MKYRAFDRRLRSGTFVGMGASDAAYYIWQVSGRAVSVHLRRSAMELIDSRVRDAYQSVPRRGAETGGILMGTKALREGHPVIIVESAEEVACEHRRGPSFSLSEKDREKLALQMRRLKAEGLVVVGYYRSHTRAGAGDAPLSLTREDQELLELWSPNAASVFLLIHPISLTKATANLFFWHEGRVSEAGEFAPFPFGGRTPELARPMPVRAHEVESPRRPETKRSAWMWVLAAVAAVGLAVTAWRLVAALASAAAHTQRTAAFDLAVERNGEQLVLRWDPRTPALASAHDGGVIIQDGGRETRYTLDRSQLASGTLGYVPATNNVTFLLETRTARGRSARGVLTVIDPSR